MKDPIRFKGKDTNFYGYAMNDPINFRDVSGLVITFGDSASQNLFNSMMNNPGLSSGDRAMIDQLQNSSA